MNADLVEQLIALFKYVAHSTQENQLKLAALERMINQHPEPNARYQAWGGKLRFVPSARAERQRIEEVIESLRQALLQDSEHCEIGGGAETCGCKARPGNIRKK